MLDGTVEVDETYIGGKQHTLQQSRDTATPTSKSSSASVNVAAIFDSSTLRTLRAAHWHSSSARTSARTWT